MLRPTQRILKKILGDQMELGNKRYSDGSVLNANWNGNNSKFYVNRYNADNRDDNIRAREKSRPHCRSTSGSEVFNPTVSHFWYFLQIWLKLQVFIILNNI